MEQYIDGLQKIMTEGIDVGNRTAVMTRSVFGLSLMIDLQKGFPALTTKRAFWRGGFVELCWMMQKDPKVATNIKYLKDNNVNFWDQWAIKGPHERVMTLEEFKMECGIKSKSEAFLSFLAEVDLDKSSPEDVVTALGKRLGVPYTKHEDDRYLQQPITKDDVIKKIMSILNCDHATASIAYADHLSSGLGDEGLPPGYASQAHFVGTHYGMGGTIAKKTCEIGDLGPVYGYLFRNWPTTDGGTIDQMQETLHNLRHNPMSRRHVVSLWHPEFLPDESYSPQENVARGRQALAPCHWMHEYKIEPLTLDERIAEYERMTGEATRREDLGTDEEIKAGLDHFNVPEHRMNLHLHLRSWDKPAGGPVNLVFYATLCHVMAAMSNMVVGKFWVTATDAHVYHNQFTQVEENLNRTPGKLPQFRIKNLRDKLEDYSAEDFELVDYNHQGPIAVPVAK